MGPRYLIYVPHTVELADGRVINTVRVAGFTYTPVVDCTDCPECVQTCCGCMNLPCTTSICNAIAALCNCCAKALYYCLCVPLFYGWKILAHPCTETCCKILLFIIGLPFAYFIPCNQDENTDYPGIIKSFVAAMFIWFAIFTLSLLGLAYTGANLRNQSDAVFGLEFAGIYLLSLYLTSCFTYNHFSFYSMLYDSRCRKRESRQTTTENGAYYNVATMYPTGEAKGEEPPLTARDKLLQYV